MGQAAERLTEANSSGKKADLSVVIGSKKIPASEALTYEAFARLENAFLEVSSPSGSIYQFGDNNSTLRAHMRIHDQRFFDRLLLAGSLGLGESYVEGWWDVDDDKLSDFLGICLQNRLDVKFREKFWSACSAWLRALIWNPSYLRAARRCISAHYDLSNNFFKLWLDKTMTYSCGYQQEPQDSLEKMQLQKYERTCKKLNLERGGTLLDIGCGWGGLAIYAARRFPGLRVTGITISQNQHEWAKNLALSEGLNNRVRFLLKDYREIEGKFDAIVSIGMFEHVGLANYRTFMEKVAALLKPDGVGLLHTIGLTDDPQVRADPWITRYIFPGARLPRLEEIVSELRRVELSVAHVENWKLHYAETLRHWKNSFDNNQLAIRSLGGKFDQRFMRLWNYYLQSCEASFRHSNVDLFQVLFTPAYSWNLPRTFNI